MAPRKKQHKTRNTVMCFFLCLMKNQYYHVLRWINKEEKIFSILFKHKKSPDWDAKYLAFFKELDVFLKKSDKYASKDSDLECKRRCKANLQKLCKDKVFKFLKEKQIDKCTKIKYYQFLEMPKEMNDEHFLLDHMLDVNLAYMNTPIVKQEPVQNTTCVNIPMNMNLQNWKSAYKDNKNNDLYQNNCVGNIGNFAASEAIESMCYGNTSECEIVNEANLLHVMNQTFLEDQRSSNEICNGEIFNAQLENTTHANYIENPGYNYITTDMYGGREFDCLSRRESINDNFFEESFQDERDGFIKSDVLLSCPNLEEVEVSRHGISEYGNELKFCGDLLDCEESINFGDLLKAQY